MYTLTVNIKPLQVAKRHQCLSVQHFNYIANIQFLLQPCKKTSNADFFLTVYLSACAFGQNIHQVAALHSSIRDRQKAHIMLKIKEVSCPTGALCPTLPYVVYVIASADP